jgi:hypothetical protein
MNKATEKGIGIKMLRKGLMGRPRTRSFSREVEHVKKRRKRLNKHGAKTQNTIHRLENPKALILKNVEN